MDAATQADGLAPTPTIAPPIRSRVNLRRHPDWQGVIFNHVGLPVVYCNSYRCGCGTAWQTEASFASYDRCPTCDLQNDPWSSDWIGPAQGEGLWRALPDFFEDEDRSGPVSCRCGWHGGEEDLTCGTDTQDGMYSDTLCPACGTDHFLSGFDAAVNQS